MAHVTVPPVVLGFPLYPLEEARLYLARQLVRAGYSVHQGLEPNEFIVSWEKARPSKAPARAPEPVDDTFTSLANLQKTAEKIRKGR